MLIALILFVLLFLAIMPQSQVFLLGSAASAGAWITAWAPFSYLLLLILLVLPFVGIQLIRSWPEREEPENPMAKYRRELPVDEE